MGGSWELQAEVWHPAWGEHLPANCMMAPPSHRDSMGFSFQKGTCGLRNRDHGNMMGPSSPSPCYLCSPYSPPLLHMLSHQEFLTVPTACLVTTAIPVLTLPTTGRISLSAASQTPTWD